MKNISITLIQSEPVWHNIDKNIEHCGILIESIDSATDLIILPEMFTTGFTMRPEGLAGDMNSRTVTVMKEWSRTTGADITGSIIINENQKYFNRLIWVKPDGTLYSYDKRHLFRMSGEEKVYTAGNRHLTVELCGWRIRPFICYDLRFPVWTRNSTLEYDLAVFTANWPSARNLHWKTLLQARAIENLCYTAGVNRTGSDGNGTAYSGESLVFDFKGCSIYSADDRESIRTVELSYSDLLSYRERFPAWEDSDRFTLL